MSVQILMFPFSYEIQQNGIYTTNHFDGIQKWGGLNLSTIGKSDTGETFYIRLGNAVFLIAGFLLPGCTQHWAVRKNRICIFVAETFSVLTLLALTRV